MEYSGKLPLISLKIANLWFIMHGNLDPHPHQIKIRIRIRIHIKVISWIRNLNLIRINLQMTSQNVWHWSIFEHIFIRFSLYLEARLLIRIHIKLNSRIPDPHQIIRIRICISIRVISRIGSASGSASM
jgi:hypothetical protein